MSRACAILCLCGLFSACARTAAPPAWVETLQENHRRAEEALRQNDRETARRLLLASLDALPERLPESEARPLRQDVFFRLAVLDLDAGRPREALAWTEKGLAFGGGDLFAANLHIARGRALEALGDDAEAAAAYHEALKINERLLDQALPSQGEP